MKTPRPMSIASALMGAALGIGVAGAALANGDVFFGAQEIPGNPQFVYYGTVKDDKGKRIQEAAVKVRIADPELVFTAFTDVLGRYRTPDMGLTIIQYGYEIDPKAFSIDVEKNGYVVARQFLRSKARQTVGAVEIDIIMSPGGPGAQPKK